ncbi:hypothetical protein NKDENANG_03334 [Candidatus Entotheonellaceae bacterium PAL068K]
MKMSDKPTVDVDIFVEAFPQQVWKLVTNLTLMGEWSPEYQGGEWIDGATGPVVGARFKGRNKRGDREWESTSTVTEAKPDRAVAWAVGDPENPGASWRIELVPEGPGTRVKHHVQLGPGPSGLTARIAEVPDREEDVIVARIAEHRRNMQTTLAGLKTAAELRTED